MRILFLAVFLFVAGPAFADEVDLGTLNLTRNQITRMWQLHSNLVRGFTESEGVVKVNTARAITTPEKNTIIADLQALPDQAIGTAKDREEFVTHPFKNITPDQAEAYIDANVTDLASAKVVMKRMVRVLIYLVRRSDL